MLCSGLIGFAGAIGRWRTRHGVRRDLDRRAVVVRPGARAGKCHRAHGGDLYDRCLREFPHLASQRRLAAGDTARHRGRARSGARRLDLVECRRRASCGHSWPPTCVLLGIFILLKAWQLAPGARRARRHGSGRSDSWPAFSMRAAVAAGARSPRQALVGSGHAPRMAVGSVNTTEFFVTVAAATTFFVELGASPWKELLALVDRRRARRAARRLGWSSAYPRACLMIAVGLPRNRPVTLADRKSDEVGVNSARPRESGDPGPRQERTGFPLTRE